MLLATKSSSLWSLHSLNPHWAFFLKTISNCLKEKCCHGPWVWRLKRPFTSILLLILPSQRPVKVCTPFRPLRGSLHTTGFSLTHCIHRWHRPVNRVIVNSVDVAQSLLQLAVALSVFYCVRWARQEYKAAVDGVRKVVVVTGRCRTVSLFK